jgi:hypothetical protein
MANHWDRIESLFVRQAGEDPQGLIADMIRLLGQVRGIVQDSLVPGTSHHELTLSKSGIRSPYTPHISVRPLGSGRYALQSSNMTDPSISIWSASLDEVINTVKLMVNDIKEDEFYNQYLAS